jgi:pyruvate formate lyase activating enzyme
MQEARLYEGLENERVRCNLCAHRCLIAEGNVGVCNVRQNVGGKLYSLVYGQLISRHIDPIEKKPLYHFFPGSTAYSIATLGCNFRCQWCQNWEIAQMPRERGRTSGYETTPRQVLAEVLDSGCLSIAYTYTEPTVFFEYSYDIAQLAKQNGIANVYVTNGYMTTEMLELFHPYLDAANVDLKAFREETYRHYVGARLQPVLDSLKKMKELGIWVEITTLVVPGINDNLGELREIAHFIANELDPGTPWHLSRFFPQYQLTDLPPTDVDTLEAAQRIGHEEGLKYVYLGNVGGESNTRCPDCGALLVRRRGYWIPENRLFNGTCPKCHAEIEGVWA